MEIFIGNIYHEAVGFGSKRKLVEKRDSYQYVPLLPSLKSHQSIREQVEQCPLRVRSDGILEDICDCELYKRHPLFSTSPANHYVL